MTFASLGCDFVSLVLPEFHEELITPSACDGIRRLPGPSENPEFIFVDDGSSQSRGLTGFVVAVCDAAAPQPRE